MQVESGLSFERRKCRDGRLKSVLMNDERDESDAYVQGWLLRAVRMCGA